MKKLIIIIAVIAFSSCKKSNDVKPVDSVSFGSSIIPTAVAPAVDTFLVQAKRRNINVDLTLISSIVLADDMPNSDLELYKQDTSAQTPVTRAARYDSSTKTIYIVTGQDQYINNKEALIFHMLGKILLNRANKDGYFNSRGQSYFDPISIMNSSSEPDYIGNGKRDYYINELFDQTTPKPLWAN